MPDAPGGEVGVEARDVWRSFGQVQALRGMSLTAPYGEVTALVGPNGSGKTTLFLVLATLLAPDDGRIEVGGHHPATEPDTVRSRIGWMPDMFGMYDQLTAREYLSFFARSYRLPRGTIVTRVEELLERVRLGQPYSDQPVHVLSRGQKQRLGVARALIHEPSVLLLDEPASGLDPRARVELRDLLRALAGEGVAVLVSSHILAELEEIADSVVIVDRGVTAGAHRLDTAAESGRHRQAWRLRALDPPGLAAALDGREIGHGPTSSAGIEIEPHTEAEIADLLAGLMADGVRLVACMPAVSDIEAAYLELTEEQR